MSEAQDTQEWQANYFASCILMPQPLVHETWKDHFGHTQQLCLSDLRSNGPSPERAAPPIRRYCRRERSQADDSLFEKVARPMAATFNVSKPAMRIRLENLGLLVRETPRQQGLTGII